MRIKPKRVTWREVGDDVVALDSRTSDYLGLNSTGKVLWMALITDGGATRDELIAALLSEFEVEQEQAAADVDQFLDDLRGRDLLEP